MAQFIVYKNPDPETRNQYPYLLDIQSDLLGELRTTIVVPLSSANTAAPMNITRLNPSLALDGETYFAMTQDVAGINRDHLGTKAFDVSAQRSEIMDAVDFVLSGI